MLKKGRKLMAVLLSVILVLCALPLSSIAANNPEVIISSNITNGVADDSVEFDYMVSINNQPYNGTVKGSDSKDYVITDGKLTMPYNVSVAISVEDGDSYDVKRLAYSSGKYKPVAESEAKSGTIESIIYSVSVNGGEEKKINQSDYNTSTNNGAEESIIRYVDKDGIKYTADEVSSISGYTVSRKDGGTFSSVTYSMDEYTGYYLKNSVIEKHSVNIDNVSCSHNKPKFGFSSYSNSLTGYFDDVADEPKTKSENNQINFNNCNSNLNANSMRVYHDHAEVYTAQNKAAVFEKNDVVNCTGPSNASGNGTYASPAVENTLYVFDELAENSYEYSAKVNDNPSAQCTFDVALIIPTAVIKVKVADCKGNAIADAQYKVTNAEGNDIALSANTAVVPLGKYTLTVDNIDESYELDNGESSIYATEEDAEYTLSAVYHKSAEELADYAEATCEDNGYQVIQYVSYATTLSKKVVLSMQRGTNIPLMHTTTRKKAILTLHTVITTVVFLIQRTAPSHIQ